MICGYWCVSKMKALLAAKRLACVFEQPNVPECVLASYNER